MTKGRVGKATYKVLTSKPVRFVSTGASGQVVDIAQGYAREYQNINQAIKEGKYGKAALYEGKGYLLEKAYDEAFRTGVAGQLNANVLKQRYRDPFITRMYEVGEVETTKPKTFGEKTLAGLKAAGEKIDILDWSLPDYRVDIATLKNMGEYKDFEFGYNPKTGRGPVEISDVKPIKGFDVEMKKGIPAIKAVKTKTKGEKEGYRYIEMDIKEMMKGPKGTVKGKLEEPEYPRMKLFSKYDKVYKIENLKERAFKTREEKLRNERLKDEKLKDEKLKDERLKDEKLKEEKLKEEKLKEDRLLIERMFMKDERFVEERVVGERVRSLEPLAPFATFPGMPGATAGGRGVGRGGRGLSAYTVTNPLKYLAGSYFARQQAKVSSSESKYKGMGIKNFKSMI
jgi:hypothetical protein